MELAFQRKFRPAGYDPFHFRIRQKPTEVSPELAPLWGGYAVKCKLVPNKKIFALKNDMVKLRNAALSMRKGRKFLIDISDFEYVENKARRAGRLPHLCVPSR